MPEYAYTATDRTGRPVQGTIFAENSALAAGKVRELGYTPEKLRAVEGAKAERSGRVPGQPRQNENLAKEFKEAYIYPVANGVPLKDLAIFYRQLSTMINAGIPLYQSLMTMESQTRNPKLAGILRDCQLQVQSGGKISEVFANYNWVFDSIQIEMIRAAEQGGMLEKMLLRIADYLEQELALRRLISRLTIYPKITVIVALFLLGKSFFVDAMPAISKLVLGQMGKGEYSGLDYLNDTLFFLIFVLLIAFGIVAFCRLVLFKSPGMQEKYERFKMSIPGLGQVVQKFALAKFGHAFGAMYEGGLGLHTAIRVAGDASGSRVIAAASRRALTASEKGATLAEAFRATGVFPPIVLDMMNTGEKTGNLDAMMQKVAEYLESDAETKAHQYSHIFAAAIGLLVAVAVGFAVVRFWSGVGSGIQGAINDAGG